MTTGRAGLRVLGHASLVLGAAGVALPLLPTTPFLLLALWAFARSDPRLADRLRSSPRFGAALRDWEEAGAISRPAKLRALAAMALGWVVLALAVRSPWALGAASACMVAVAAFLATRPEPRRTGCQAAGMR